MTVLDLGHLITLNPVVSFREIVIAVYLMVPCLRLVYFVKQGRMHITSVHKQKLTKCNSCHGAAVSS